MGGARAGASEDWALPPRRTGRPAPADLAQRRAALRAELPAGGPSSMVELVTVDALDWVICTPPAPRATVVWFHGGGYRLGSAVNSAPFGLRLAEAAGLRVVLVDYALAPEQPFPAALHDAASAYDGVIGRWPGSVLLGGDSAGGGVALALAATARSAGRPPPAGLALLSPWADLTVGASSYRTRADRDELFSDRAAREAAELYLQGWPASDPLASPLFAEMSGFPPTVLFASTEEVLLDDALRLAGRLAEAGRPVSLHLVPGVPHVWPTLLPEHPASLGALEEIACFVSILTGGPVVPRRPDR